MYRRAAQTGAWREEGRGGGSSGTGGRSTAQLWKARAVAGFLVAFAGTYAAVSAVAALRTLAGSPKIGQELPLTEGGQQLGLSPGNYSLLAGSTCLSCADRIQRLCGFRISGRGACGRCETQGFGIWRTRRRGEGYS
jgi:hypothetical protein